MAKRRNFGYALCILLVCALPVWGQVLPLPTVEPGPLPGGDILPPLFNQFFPGVGPLFDGLNAGPPSIRGTTSEPSRLSAQEGQPQRRPTVRSSKYELTSGSPVRGPQ